jgi:hypothetical protein
MTDSKLTDSKLTDSKLTDSIEEKMPEKMNIADNASLAFFTNPVYLNILQRKKLCDIKDNTEELKFYRKRIVALFKDLLKEPSENREIKEIHTMFVNAAIRYFEVTDKKDIIQEQHTEGKHTEGKHTEGEFPSSGGPGVSPEEIFTIDEANDAMMRKTISVANLDNYVIMKQDNSANETRIIPIKIDIDLKTDGLKTKGVPPKKPKQKSKI